MDLVDIRECQITNNVFCWEFDALLTHPYTLLGGETSYVVVC